MKLSICIVTMNRARQLKEAIESCLECNLPAETEFVIVDNASTDHTDQIVESVLGNCRYSYIYERQNINLGCGIGRNYAYNKASGEYVYILDDDAVIDFENNPDFFKHAIEIMDNNIDIMTLATQIYDVVWQANRQQISGPKISEGLYKCMMFCGGSHFLRKDFFPESPYFANQYGCEEFPPSLKTMDEGKINAFCPDLLVIHKPIVNRWNYNNEENQIYLIKGIAILYAIKKMMYPRIFVPLLHMAFRLRCKKYLKGFINHKEKSNELIKETREILKGYKRIKVRTVARMYKDFRMSVF